MSRNKGAENADRSESQEQLPTASKGGGDVSGKSVIPETETRADDEGAEVEDALRSREIHPKG